MVLPVSSCPAALARWAPRACASSATILGIFASFGDAARLRGRVARSVARRPGDLLTGAALVAEEFGCGERRCVCRRVSLQLLRNTRGLARIREDAAERPARS